MQTPRINSLQASQCWTPTGRWSPVLTDRRGFRKVFSLPQQCWSSSIQTSCTVSVERHTPSFIPKIPQPCIEDNRFSGFSFDLAAFLPSVPHAAATSALLSKDQAVVWSSGWEELLQSQKQTRRINQLNPAPIASTHSLCLGSSWWWAAARLRARHQHRIHRQFSLPPLTLIGLVPFLITRIPCSSP